MMNPWKGDQNTIDWIWGAHSRGETELRRDGSGKQLIEASLISEIQKQTRVLYFPIG